MGLMMMVFVQRATVQARRVQWAWRLVAMVALLGAAALPGATGPVVAATPIMQLRNMDAATEAIAGLPFTDRLVMNRIQNPEKGTRNYYTPPGQPKRCCIPPNIVHDVSTLRIINSSADQALTISNLSIVGRFELATPPALPLVINANQFADVKVRFVAQEEGLRGGLYGGALTIQSDDPATPTKAVELVGFWQLYSEVDPSTFRSQEPTIQELHALFGFNFALEGPWKNLNNNGLREAVGDEVVSGFWKRADASKPVTVQQIAAYHGQGNTETISWNNKGSATTTSIFTQEGDEGQSLFPHINDNLSKYAVGTFNPSGPFGLRSGGEWSNSPDNRDEVGCPAENRCGHHLRFWPLRDRAGQVVPNTYFMIMDYYSTTPGVTVNYDFQDNIYILSNIQPENQTVPTDVAQPQALLRLDTGADVGTNYTDIRGNTWRSDESIKLVTTTNPDTGQKTTTVQPDQVYSPAPMPDENPNANAIANTDDDQLFRSYRGNTGGNTRLVTYELPVGMTNRTVDVKLYFAERFQTSANQRLFDVTIEGAQRENNLDIFERAGGKDTALTLSYSAVAVNDGKLTIQLDARPESGGKDYPSIAGIEVLCRSLCTSPKDFTIPAKLTNLTATPAANGISLDWDSTAETDFKSYVVYRSTKAAGPWTPIKTITSRATSNYVDQAAPSGIMSYYRVEAVDQSNNQSDPAFANALLTGTIDTTPPAVPSGLSATNTEDGVALNWNNNTTNPDFVGFNLYRAATAAGPFEKINETLLTSSDFLDGGVLEGDTAVYRVTAVDASGNESAQSNAVTITRPNTTPPAMPAGLVFTTAGPSIALDWDNNTEGDLQGYNVYRVNNGQLTRLNNAALADSAYTLTNVPICTVAAYQIKAIDSAGNESAGMPLNLTRVCAPIVMP